MKTNIVLKRVMVMVLMVALVMPVIMLSAQEPPVSRSGGDFDDYKVSRDDIPASGITLDQTSLTLKTGSTYKLKATVTPEETTDKTVYWSSSNTGIAAVNEKGVVTSVAEGVATITATAKTGTNVTAQSVVTVDNNATVTDLEILSNENVSLRQGAKHFFGVRLFPIGITSEEVEWSSSNSDVAKIDPATGFLEVVSNTGTAQITARIGEIYDVITVTATSDTREQEFITMQNRWTLALIGEPENDTSIEAIRNFINRMTQDAQKIWDTLDLNGGYTNNHMFPGYETHQRKSAQYTLEFNNLKAMASAFTVQGGTLYQDRKLYEDIMAGLKYLTEDMMYNGTWYNTGGPDYFNWWDWQIGCTQAFADILVLLEPYTDSELILKYAAIIFSYGDKDYGANYEGANGTDIATAQLGAAIASINDTYAAKACPFVTSQIKLTTSGDGVYADGSYISHNKTPYTGSYGTEFLKGLSKIPSIVAGTRYQCDTSSMTIIYEFIDKGVLPLIHDGQMMNMVGGRSVSRPSVGGMHYTLGRDMMNAIIKHAEGAPVEYKTKFLSAVKYNITQANPDTYDYYGSSTSFDMLMNFKNIIEDESIQAVSYPYSGMTVYGSMDRAVQINNNFTAGVSIHSTRTYAYESINGENLKGWHTGDGMLYIYNNDLHQFGETYWGAVDFKRLPGTTVDMVALSNLNQKVGGYNWAGGVTDGTSGVVGVMLNKASFSDESDLIANKSWFLINGKVIALGTNIASSGTTDIDTIVENRLLNEAGDNALMINGSTLSTPYDGIVAADSWLHMAGTVAGADIGYYFPESTELNVKTEQRTGSYAEINTTWSNPRGDDTTYTGSFFNVSIPHGTTPNNAGYAYALLPGMSAAETGDYAANNSLQILQNDSIASAVKEGDVTGMNIWRASGAAIDDYLIDKSASMMIKKNGNNVKISIANPKQDAVTIKVTTPSIFTVSEKDDEITVGSDNKSFTVNTNGAAGKSFSITLTYQ